MVPAAATVYCMGIEAYTTEVRGFDFSAFNKYRFQKSYEAALLDNVKHRWVTLRARWVALRARWVALRARWVTLRACWVTLRARWVTLQAPHQAQEGVRVLLRREAQGAEPRKRAEARRALHRLHERHRLLVRSLFPCVWVASEVDGGCARGTLVTDAGR
jgi:hypothetical protein